MSASSRAPIDVAAVGAEADVEADDIGLLQQVVQLNELDAHIFRPFG